MNVRAMTVFFWGGLMSTATVVSTEHRSELEIDFDSDQPQVAVTQILDEPAFNNASCEPRGAGQDF